MRTAGIGWSPSHDPEEEQNREVNELMKGGPLPRVNVLLSNGETVSSHVSSTVTNVRLLHSEHLQCDGC